jgi:uncharacterized phage protein (TIGR02220 family)
VRQFVIPETFFKSIAEKGKLYSRIWFYWLAEKSDEMLELDFIEKEEIKFPNISEIREIYEFGIQLLRQDFKIIQQKEQKAKKPISRQERKMAQEIIDYLNNQSGTSFSLKGNNMELISARLKEGFLFDDFKIVIDKKVKDWKGTDWVKYLRPSTLFSKSKFENYLNSKDNEPTNSNDFTKFTDSILKASQYLNALRKK